MTPSSQPIHRTANLTLAAFLAHHDKPYRLVRGEGRSATWEFDLSQVAVLVRAFESSEASVEPQAFHHSITRTRRMLFDFINGKDDCWTAEYIAKHEPTKPGR